MMFVDHDERLRAIAEHRGLRAIVERMLGGPAQLIQDMALIKPPHGGREKPWHQDKAYFDYPVGTPVVGIWIALDAATVENGCMHVFRAHIARGRLRISWCGTGSFAMRTWKGCRARRLHCRQEARCFLMAFCTMARHPMGPAAADARSSFTMPRSVRSASVPRSG